MPELPEVEITRRGVEPLVVGRTICRVVLRTEKLRWPLDPELQVLLDGQAIRAVSRRAKYLLFHLEQGGLLLHLGMSGHLRVVDDSEPAGKHDHVDICFEDGTCLRMTDPRRFGALLWTDGDPSDHPLLAKLGPEPLSEAFDGDLLYRHSRRRSIAVKAFLLDQKTVVGVGNIYANESLFLANIRPDRPAGQISLNRYRILAAAIDRVLRLALEAGGTTLADFRQVDGRPGYFRQQLQVYGRAGSPCLTCGHKIVVVQQNQRSTFFCRHCQR
ncbi:MAG: DNA-formamidopyrimidine glycosylase [Desulfuromonas sp.]|nr:MAG: DNA-formamidopyrimidine glycosylase [Desulfuromonas sp.]